MNMLFRQNEKKGGKQHRGSRKGGGVCQFQPLAPGGGEEAQAKVGARRVTAGHSDAVTLTELTHI